MVKTYQYKMITGTVSNFIKVTFFVDDMALIKIH